MIRRKKMRTFQCGGAGPILVKYKVVLCRSKGGGVQTFGNESHWTKKGKTMVGTGGDPTGGINPGGNKVNELIKV